MMGPCKDCSDRHARCHAECEKYGEFVRVHAEEKKRLADKAKPIYDAHHFRGEMILKEHKKNRGRRI